MALILLLILNLTFESDQNPKMKLKEDSLYQRFCDAYGKSENSQLKRVFNENFENLKAQNAKIFKKNLKFSLNLNKMSDMSWDEFEDNYLMKFSNKNEQSPFMNQNFPKVKSREFFKYINEDFDEYAKKNGFQEQNQFQRNLGWDFFSNFFSQYNQNYRTTSAGYKISNDLTKYPDKKSWKSDRIGVQDQGRCAACYAFAAISAIELIYGLDESQALSTQEVIDCSSRNKGCNGGNPYKVFDYHNSKLLGYDKYYDFMQYQQTCQNLSLNQRFSGKIDYYFVEDPVDLILALQKGPVVIIQHVNQTLKNYDSGIFNDEECNGTLNHAATVVGYDLSGEIPYIELKNAWGSDWGEGGYYKMSLGDVIESGKGICNMFSHPYNVVPVKKGQLY